LKEIYIDPEIKEKFIKVIDLSVNVGDFVKPFTGANMSLGDIFLKFENREQLDKTISTSDEWIKIILE